MASVALMLRVVADTADATNDMRQLGQETDSFGQRAAKVAAVAAGFAAVSAGIMKAAQSASALEQASGGVEAVFKSGADQVKKWADQAATSIGLSKSQYMELATLIGAQLKNAGVSMDELGGSTNQLIQQGADLAAMFGGTTAEAVEAISSALKGERDPIEKYGITLTEASIQAEILAMGLDTSTTAAKQNAKAMATMSLITKQGADAWGAAAREADTYASQQQVLRAVFENTMASLGSVFLPMLADLAGAFADLMPAVETILTPVAQLIALVAGLPTPILATVAAFAAWKLLDIGGFVGKMFTSMQGAWTGFAREMQSAKIGSFLSQSGQSMSTFGAASQAAQKQFGGFLSSLGKSVGAFAAFAIAAMAVSQFVDSLNDGEEVLNAFQASVNSLADAMVDAGSTDWSSSMQATYEAAARASDGFQALTAAGVDAGLALRYMTDQGFTPSAAEADQLSAAVSDLDWQTAMSVSTFRDQAGAAQQSAASLLEKKAADTAAAEAAAAAGAATTEQTQLLQEQAAAAAKSAVEASKVAVEQTGVATAMRDAEAATSAAKRALDAFSLAMDQLAGRNITAEQAALALNNGMRGLQEAFDGAATSGGYSVEALASWNVAALTSTKGGADLYGALNDVRSGYDASVASAYQQAAATGDSAAAMAAARAAADSAYQGFITLATQAGLTGEQAAQLAAKLGIVAGTDIPDKTFQLIAEDQAAQASLTAAQQAEIDTKTFDVNALISPALGQFSLLTGTSLTNTVDVGANTSAAQGDIKSVTGAKYSTTVDANANTSAAQSTMQGFTSAQRSTTVDVQANTGPAQGAVTALVNQQRTLTITVDANTSPAQNAINSIQGRTVTVTVTTVQNTVQGTTTSAPAMMAADQAGPMAMAAADPVYPAAPGGSPLMAESVAYHRALAADNGNQSAAPTVVNNFTINGALDSEAVARQIDQILTRASRRRVGIDIGRRVVRESP